MPEQPRTRIQSFVLTGYSAQSQTGTVTITAFNREQRGRRALVGLGKWWGAALLSLVIPVAHFLLVPGFLLYGVVQCVERWHTVELARGARGTCPDCGSEQPLEVRSRWHVPQAVTCSACQRGLQISIG